jgi:hypothetical protein
MSKTIFSKVVGDLSIHEPKVKKPFLFTGKFSMSKEEIEKLKQKPLEYKITQFPVPKDQVFTFDGYNVKVNLENLGNLHSFLPFKTIVTSYYILTKVLNEEQVYICPYCNMVDLVSSLAMDIEHIGYDCRTGHYDRFFWEHSSFTPRAFSLLPIKVRDWERNSIDKLYRSNKKYFGKTPINTTKVLDMYSFVIARDLGVKKFKGGYRNRYFN